MKTECLLEFIFHHQKKVVMFLDWGQSDAYHRNVALKMSTYLTTGLKTFSAQTGT